MIKQFSALVLLFLASAAPLLATQRLVPQQYATIQAAINASANTDTILVSPGRYYENIKFNGKNITLASLFLTTQDTSYIRSTIIDGSQPQYPDTASVVRFINNEDSTTVLAGFTLTGGKGTKWPDPNDGGVYREGGAILCQNSSPIIRNNFIYLNEATSTAGVLSAGGGAIRSDGGNPQILNNIIMRNKGRYGAGIVLNYSGAIVRNNIICLNSGGQDIGGSGIWMHGTKPATPPKFIENNTIVGNKAGQGGGGIAVLATTATLRNNIIWGNRSGTNLSQIGLSAGGTVSASYSLIQGGYPGIGNLIAHPQFADSAALLLPVSVAVDAGDPATEFHDKASPAFPSEALFPAMGTLRNDMGAYGGPGAATFISFSQPGFLSPSQVQVTGATQGQAKTVKIAISNLGLANLHIDSVSIKIHAAQFQAQTSIPLTLNPAINDTIAFIWIPAASGNFRDTLLVYHNDAFQVNPKQIRLTSTVLTGVTEAAGTVFGLTAAPNPFGHFTSMQFSLPSRATISVSVADVLGREVITVPASEKEPGNHQVVINGSLLPQGLYFCRLQARLASGEITTSLCRLVVQR